MYLKVNDTSSSTFHKISTVRHSTSKLFFVRKLVRGISHMVSMEFVSKRGLKRIQIHACTHVGKEVLKWDVEGKTKHHTADSPSDNLSVEGNRYIDVGRWYILGNCHFMITQRLLMQNWTYLVCQNTKEETVQQNYKEVADLQNEQHMHPVTTKGLGKTGFGLDW